jgi:hypothetical protein
MKVLRCLAPTVFLLAVSVARTLSAGEFLTVISPTFTNVPALCSGGYVYQVFDGDTCADQSPQQPLNGVVGIG